MIEPKTLGKTCLILILEYYGRKNERVSQRTYMDRWHLVLAFIHGNLISIGDTTLQLLCQFGVLKLV